ncbi:MAG TPA: peptide ABC transporter substrate-binding protein [Phycisphaerales bacterium]|nr:peptide ABC transporter substrate-binding protein [Phycisphaerales bacterium]
MLRALVPVLLLVVLVGLSVALDRPQPPADFTFGNGNDVTTLDLQKMSWMQDLRVARLLFEGLAANDVFTDGYDPIPAAAERWDISEDGREYVFHLRPTAKWSNGEPLRAGDFVFAWRRAILPDTAADYSGLFMFIEGAQDFADWRADALAEFARSRPANQGTAARAQAARDLWAETERRFDEVVGVRAVDDRTLVVRLDRPVPYFLDLCAFATFYPVYPPLVRQYDRLDTETGRIIAEAGWTQPPRLISNGPFKLTVWRFKRDMRLEANEHWWDADSLGVRSIAIPSIEEPNAQVLAFRTGSVQYLADVTVPYRREMHARKQEFYREHWNDYVRLLAEGHDQFEIDRRLPDDPRAHVHVVPAFGTYFYNFNCRPALPDGRPNPFADARVRRAFAMCIDKRAIAEEVRGLGEPVARTLIPAGSLGGYESPRGLDCLSDASDEAGRQAIAGRARALLTEAGYDDPSRFPTVEVLFNKDAGHDLIAQSVARNWQKYLGVPVRLAQKEIKVFRDDLKNHNFMTSRAGWYGDYGDPTTFLEINRTGDGNNDRAYSSSEFDALLDDAARETDPARRMALLSEAERILVERDLPLVPIFHYCTVTMFNAHELSGPNPHPRTNENIFLYDVLGDGKGSDRVRTMPLHPRGPAASAAGGAAP